jgi:hypothetical protein
MSLEAWVGTIVGIITILSSVILGVKWLVKHYFNDIKHELKPNGGSSMKDQVNKLEKEIEILKSQHVKIENSTNRVDSKIDKLTELFIVYTSRQK